MKILLLLILVGCTPLTEQQKYDRNNDLAIAKDKYFELARACKMQGGYMVVQRPMREIGSWSKWDFQSAKCATRKIY